MKRRYTNAKLKLMIDLTEVSLLVHIIVTEAGMVCTVSKVETSLSISHIYFVKAIGLKDEIL